MTRWFALVVVLAATPPPAAEGGATPADATGVSAEPPADTGKPSDPATPPQEAGIEWYVFGAPFYLPETRLGLGLVAGVHRELCTGCQPSSVHLESAYTMNGQFTISVSPRLFTSPSFSVGLQAKYSNFPDWFYGIGPYVGPVGEAFTPRTFELTVTPEFFVVPRKLRVGPKLHLRRDEITAIQAGGMLASGAIQGWSGFSAAGIGASVTWDTRDSQFFPRRGTWLEAWILAYPGSIGGHPDFARAAVDATWLVPLGGDHVLALDASLAGGTGAVPFTLLAGLGGAHTLRGYRDGWYRDRFGYGLQAEWRFPIVGRLRGVLFGGVGDVAPSLTSFGLTTIRAAAGAGLRFRLTSDGVYLRVDLATRGEEPELYMLVLEAF